MELFTAHKQWANRPDDQRFRSVSELYKQTRAYADTAKVKDVSYSVLRTESTSDEVQVVGNGGVPARLTNWAFGQLAARVGAPAAWLRKLTPALASENLNYGLKSLATEDTAKQARLLFHQNGGLLLRAITSDEYARIWNWEVAERLLDLEQRGWEPARPDSDPSGFPALYASDHDMFAFMRSRNVTVAEPGSDQPIWRGVIVSNSEVGSAALKMTRFLYRYMCGNHIIWGASKVLDLNVRHIGDARERWAKFAITANQWLDESASDEQAMIAKAQTKVIAATKEGVLDALFGKRSLGLSRKTIEAGYDAVNQAEDGNPNSVWGMVQGLTRHSQSLPYADERVELDRRAGKVLDMVDAF